MELRWSVCGVKLGKHQSETIELTLHLKGKVAPVAGGSSGIGRAAALALVQEAAGVVVAAAIFSSTVMKFRFPGSTFSRKATLVVRT